jgi:hypothetical protein
LVKKGSKYSFFLDVSDNSTLNYSLRQSPGPASGSNFPHENQ